MKSKIFVCIVVLQMLMLVVSIKVFCSGTYESYFVLDNMVSENITQQDDGTWYVDEQSGINSSTKVLSGPYISLDKGSYSIVVEYESNENQIMEIKNHSGYLYINDQNREITLKDGKNVETIKISAAQNIDAFEIRLYYSGKGYIKINGISIVRNNVEQKENILLAAFVMLILDICIYFGSIKRSRYFLKLCPIIAGMITGASLSYGGGGKRVSVVYFDSMQRM